MPLPYFPDVDLPVPTETPGPDWASDLVDAITEISNHNHATGAGAPLTQSSFTFDDDLDFNMFGAINLRGTFYNNLAANPSENRSVFFKSGEFFVKDGSGNAVQITLAGALNIGSAGGGFGGDYGGPGVNAVATYSNTSKTFTFLQEAGQTALMACGDIAVTEPIVSGNSVTIQAPTGLAAGYDWIYPDALPSTDGALLFISDAGQIEINVEFDATANAYLFQNLSSTESDLQFRGLISSGKQEWKTTDISSNTTITDTDNNLILLVDTTGGAVTITLPDPTLGRRVVMIKDVADFNENNCTIAPDGSENIDGVAASKVLDQMGGTWVLISDLTDWWTIQDQKPAVSITEFNDQTLENIPETTPASLNMNAPAVTVGTGVTVSTNTLTFPFNGYWKLDCSLMQLEEPNGYEQFAGRIQNTTGGTTVKEFGLFGAEEPGSASPVEVGQKGEKQSIVFEITDKTDDYEVQFVSNSLAASIRLHGEDTIQGLQGYSYVYVFTYLGTDNTK